MDPHAGGGRGEYADPVWTLGVTTWTAPQLLPGAFGVPMPTVLVAPWQLDARLNIAHRLFDDVDGDEDDTAEDDAEDDDTQQQEAAAIAGFTRVAQRSAAQRGAAWRSAVENCRAGLPAHGVPKRPARTARRGGARQDLVADPNRAEQHPPGMRPPPKQAE